jgi:hypothetical protein
MGVFSLMYIPALYLVESYTNIHIPAQTHDIFVTALSIAASILFYIAWWHLKNPAVYEAYISKDEFSVVYPGSKMWSFKVQVKDIEKIEHRQSHGGGGKSIVDTGLVMKDGQFHKISMNYGNNVNKMHKVLKSINPEIEFPYTIKTSYHLFGKNK